MPLNFPNSPTNNQIYTTDRGDSYRYDSGVSAWLAVSSSVTGNSRNNQILYNSSNTVLGSDGATFDAVANTAQFNNVAVSLNVTAQYFYGNGAFLTGVAGDLTPAFTQANTGRDHANAAFARANDSVQYNVAGTFTEKQTFNANTSAATVTLIPRSSSPTVTAEGDLWFDNVAGRLRFRLNSAAREVVQLDGLQTSTARKTFTASNTACGSIAITPVASLPNNIVQGDFVVSRTDNLVYYYADTTWRSLSTNVQLQAAFTLANIAYAHANADYAFSNSAHSIANLAFTHANNAYAQANTANNMAVGNTIANGMYQTRSSRSQLNLIETNQILYNIVDDAAGNRINVSANIVGITPVAITANAAFLHANAAFASSNADYAFSNSAHSIANLAFTHANAAFTKANSGGGAVIDLDTRNVTNYIVFDDSTSGTFANANVSTSLTFNPATGTLSATIFNSTSDRSLKNDITQITDAVTIVNKLKGVRFKWNSGSPSIGVVAQDLEEVVPELVTSSGEYKTVNYDGLIGILIEAIKELHKEVKDLRAKYEANEDR